jgi:TolB-like protein/Tfp pilus assembly protein PilF
MKTGNFFAELKRRNVYKVAVAYAVASWSLIQIATQVFPFFEIPNWAVRLVVLLLIAGFPVALVFSWAFEITPEGIKRESEIEADKSLTRHTGRKIVGITIIVALLATGLMVFQLIRPKGATTSVSKAELAVATTSNKSIAVLPFENLSDDKNAAYFADGIQDEILTKLASIADLKVISRTSTARYKSKPEDLKTVSQQLGVATVLEGSVQKAADKVRVNVQLINARADSHLWAKSYDRDIKDVFAVESEVAQEIADSLQAKLSPAEANTLATAPTKDTAAYDLFLRAEHEERLAENSLSPESYEQAAAWYQQAIARDPNFALAMARLVRNRMDRHWFFEQMTDAELAPVRTMAEHALALAPNLAEAHVALGTFFYHGYRQYEPALAEFERALQLQPNANTALEYSGYVHRRQGQWARCLDEHKRALEQDPRNALLAGNVAATYVTLRMWKEAEHAANHTLEIDPRSLEGMRAWLDSIVRGSGEIDETQRVLATFPAENKILLTADFGDVSNVMGTRAYVFVLAREYKTALKVWETAGPTAIDQRNQLSARAAIRVLAGDLNGAQAETEKARQLLEERLRERPNEISSMTRLSWIYLALKRDREAINLAQQAADLLPPEKDALEGNILQAGLAETKARAGATAESVIILRRLLSVAAGGSVSVARLKIDPVWDPIRNDPGFQQLLALKEHVGP